MDKNYARIPEDVLLDQWNGFRLRTWRRLMSAVQNAKQEGMDQQAIAERLGMDCGQLSRILSGRRNVTLQTMHNIARAIDTRLEVDLVPLKDLRPSNFHAGSEPGITGWQVKSTATRATSPARTLQSWAS